MADHRCLCLAPTMVESVRKEAVARSLRTLDNAGELGAPQRAAAASLANRLTARLVVLAAASCPRHGPSRTGSEPGSAEAADRCVSGAVDR